MSGAAGSCRRRVGVAVLLLVAALAAVLGGAEGKAHNYEDALQKSLLYFEAQRSGRLPHSQRVAWRHHSGLTDGLEQGVRTHARARAIIHNGHAAPLPAGCVRTILLDGLTW
jgi:hypothetical protein